MEKNYNTLYNVTIEFSEGLSEGDVLEIVRSNFYDEDIIEREDNKLKALWEVPNTEGIHEIENALFYILEDEEYGSYSYEKVSL